MPVSRLVELVWGDQPPRTADKTLQSYVTRLRKGLGGSSIARVGAAYRLDLDPESVDVARFQRSLAAGDIGAALEEWTGLPLAGLEVGGLSAAVDGLVEQWLGAVESDLEARIEDPAGGGAQVVGRLTELTAQYPFREGLWALLMTVLYREGRQADALAAYRRARRHLVDDLGVEPGPRLRELEASILGQDESLTVERSAGGRRRTLPTGTVTFGFLDVEDSARNWASNPSAMSEGMARLDELVRSAGDRHNGHLFSIGGDSFGIAFHRAGDAAAWAIDVRERSMAGQHGPAIRVGLHTGETEEHDQGYFGPAVILASQLAAAGHGGQILVSELTAALLGGAPLRDLGTFRLESVVDDQRILQLDDGDHPTLRTEDGNQGNLPRRTGRLIGRDDLLPLITRAMDESPIVTLVGPGGIGKTRLAIAAAQLAQVEHLGGAWLIELVGISASDDVPRAVADTLGIRDRTGRTLTQSVVEALQARRALLVLDNCEHVIDGAADLASAIAENCLDVRLLVTSREGLGLAEEKLLSVSPLEAAGPGVELFIERAAAVSPSFDPDATRAEIVEICRSLDGVPLAIELAAARVNTLSPADLVERLDDRLRLLGGGRRAGLERHRTLRATIQWSYDLLTPSEQTLFQRLSIFTGPFDLKAAELVAAEPDADADSLLGGLVEQSMVIVESGPFGRRFRLLETMRQYGAEHLRDNDQTDLIAARHADWCLTRVAAVRQLLSGRDENEGVTRLAELWSNLRSAFDWAHSTDNPELCRLLFEPIATEIYVRNQTEIGYWAQRLLEITPPEREDLRTFGIIWALRRFMRDQDPDGYQQLIERFGEPDHPMIRYGRSFLHGDYEQRTLVAPEVVAELRRNGDEYQADLFEIIGVALTLLSTGRLAEHDEMVSTLIERYRRNGPPTCLNWSLIFLGMSADGQGRNEEAAALFDEAAEVDLPEGTQTWNEPLAARAAFRRGNRKRAYQILQQHLDRLIAAQDMHSARVACAEFVNLMVSADRLAEAKYILDFLQTTNMLNNPGIRAGISASVREIGRYAESQPAQSPPTGSDAPADDREALDYMGEVLERLSSED